MTHIVLPIGHLDQTQTLRRMHAPVSGNLHGIRPAVREELARLTRLGIKPGSMWDEAIVRRMAYLSFQTDRVMAVFLGWNGEVREVRLGDRRDVDLSAPPTRRCIRTVFGEKRTLSETERHLLLNDDIDSLVSVGVGMAVPGTMCMGWRSPAGTGGVILYGPVFPPRCG